MQVVTTNAILGIVILIFIVLLIVNKLKTVYLKINNPKI